MTRILFILGGILMISTGPALAHTGAGHVAGFSAGFAHPIGGLDHFLAMVAVGILASQLRGRALWGIPLAFISVMALGGYLGMANFAVPFVEQGIIGSVLILGAVIAFGRQFSLPVAMGMVGLFGLFHGVAHGAEMPVASTGFEYGIAFITATALLHSLGLVLGLAVQGLAERSAPMALRLSGGAVSAAGVALILL